MSLIDSLVAYYKLDESSGNALDSSSNSYDLTNTASVVYSAGKINNGADVGVGNTTKKLSIANNLGITGGPITIAGWVKLNAEATPGQSREFFAQTDATTDTDYYLRYINTAGVYSLQAIRHTYGVSDLGPSVTVSAFGTTNYQHIVLTYDNTYVRLYLNGALIGSPVAASGSGSAPAVSSFDIGYNPRFALFGESKYDEVGVWNRELSAAEITTLYNSGTGLTFPFSNIVDLVVSEITVSTAKVDANILFDGGATITERGFVWSLTPTPTTTDFKAIVSGTTGAYTADISSLSSGTTYYIRGYAINSFGTTYSDEVTFDTLDVPQYDLQKPLNIADGTAMVGQINVTGTVGTITVRLGSTGTVTVINAGAGASAFSGVYSGLSGLIITRSADFNGTIDDVFYAFLPVDTVVDWSGDLVVLVTSIPSEVFFKRVESNVFNSFRFYRYLDLLFKDLDGYVTVTVRQEREDNTTVNEKTFTVGNPSSGTVSPFQKKRISFLCKNQAIIIGLSNDNLNETFSIAKYLLIGDQKGQRMFSADKIISM